MCRYQMRCSCCLVRAVSRAKQRCSDTAGALTGWAAHYVTISHRSQEMEPSRCQFTGHQKCCWQCQEKRATIQCLGTIRGKRDGSGC